MCNFSLATRVSNITRNYRQTWQMSFVVSSIVEVSMNKVILWIYVRIYDWTAESAKLVKMMEIKTVLKM